MVGNIFCGSVCHRQVDVLHVETDLMNRAHVLPSAQRLFEYVVTQLAVHSPDKTVATSSRIFRTRDRLHVLRLMVVASPIAEQRVHAFLLEVIRRTFVQQLSWDITQRFRDLAEHVFEEVTRQMVRRCQRGG